MDNGKSSKALVQSSTAKVFSDSRFFRFSDSQFFRFKILTL